MKKVYTVTDDDGEQYFSSYSEDECWAYICGYKSRALMVSVEIEEDEKPAVTMPELRSRVQEIRSLCQEMEDIMNGKVEVHCPPRDDMPFSDPLD